MLKFVIFSTLGLSKAFNMGLPTDYDDQEMMYKRSPAEMEDFMKLLSVISGLLEEFFFLRYSLMKKVFQNNYRTIWSFNFYHFKYLSKVSHSRRFEKLRINLTKL